MRNKALKAIGNAIGWTLAFTLWACLLIGPFLYMAMNYGEVM